MGIEIRKLQTKDEDHFKQLIALEDEEEYLVNLVKNNRLKRAYSAVIQETLVGVVLAWKSNFHPYCTYIRIIVHPFYLDDNVENCLLNKLENSLAYQDYPLQVSIWETTLRLGQFYKKSGFKLIRKTYMPQLELLKVKGFLRNISTDNVLSLTQVFEDQEKMLELIELVKSNYEVAHRDNPVGTINMMKWQGLILEDVILEGSYIQFDESMEHIIAYSLLHESEQEGAVELGWCGCKDRSSRNLIPKLVFQQIQYGIEQGYSTLQGEFDTTDELALEVLKVIPFTPSPAWNTYQKNK